MPSGIICTHGIIINDKNAQNGKVCPKKKKKKGHFYAYCLKLNKGMVTQPKASMLRFCLLFSSAPPGGGRGMA